MCGIAGWVSYDGNLKAHQDVITTMTKTMARRGPDAGGIWIDRHVGLGHRRLAIIDLAGGVQPMQAEEEGRTTVSLIYSGEVYNFVELRDELRQLGHKFKTCSDTDRAPRILAMGRQGCRTSQRYVRLRDLGRSKAGVSS